MYSMTSLVSLLPKASRMDLVTFQKQKRGLVKSPDSCSLLSGEDCRAPKIKLKLGKLERSSLYSITPLTRPSEIRLKVVRIGNFWGSTVFC